MPTSLYSYGAESPAKFRISDKMASNYNDATKEFLKAQRRFTQKFGRAWDPARDPIKIKWSRQQQKAWNAVAEIVNRYIAKNGPIPTGDYLDDFLVKNTVSAVAVASANGRGSLYRAAVLGALYEALRGL
jgi:hypothetical protein